MYLIGASIVLFITALALSAAARYHVSQFLTRSGNVARGILYDIGAMLNSIPRIILTALAIILGVYAITVVLIGVFSGQFWLSLWIGILLFPTWCFLYIFRAGILRVPFWIITVFLVFSLIRFMGGSFFPEVIPGWDRWAGNKRQGLRNTLDKGSGQSEAESGVFARVREGTVLRSPVNLRFLRKLEAGTPVKVMSLEGRPATPDTEGLTRVMLADQYGEFFNGQEGWVPSRKLDWDWKEEEKGASSSESSPEKSSWQICFDGKECKDASLEFFNKRTTVVVDAIEAIFTGVPKERAADGEYMGAWTMLPEVYRQPFGITFDPEFKTVDGWGMDDNGKKIIITGTRK